jgi:hypothetical protein
MALAYQTAEDVNFESRLIPDGTVAMFSVVQVKPKQGQKGTYFAIKLECIDAKYAGANVYENFFPAAPEGNYARQKTMTAIRYMMETTYQGQALPELETIDHLKNKRVVIKVGVDTYTNNDGEERIKNTVLAFGTPRTDSSNHKYYEAWDKGEQPWQSDELPEIPAAPKTNGATPPAWVTEQAAY